MSMMQIQVFCPNRGASETVQRRCVGFGSPITERSRALSPRIEILTDIDRQRCMFPSFQRSTHVRRACADDVCDVVSGNLLTPAHPATATTRAGRERASTSLFTGPLYDTNGRVRLPG